MKLDFPLKQCSRSKKYTQLVDTLYAQMPDINKSINIVKILKWLPTWLINILQNLEIQGVRKWETIFKLHCDRILWSYIWELRGLAIYRKKTVTMICHVYVMSYITNIYMLKNDNIEIGTKHR